MTATVPIGYADGLDRHLGCGRWSMRVAGRPAPIVGRVCMDSCMIDITDIPGVGEGDESVGLLARAGQRPRNDGPGARHDTLRDYDVGLVACETNLPQGMARAQCHNSEFTIHNSKNLRTLINYAL